MAEPTAAASVRVRARTLGIVAKIVLALGFSGSIVGVGFFFMCLAQPPSNYGGYCMFIPLNLWIVSVPVLVLGLLLYGAWRFLRRPPPDRPSAPG